MCVWDYYDENYSMPKLINFVGDRRKRLSRLQKQDKKIMQIATNILVVVFIIFLVVLGLRVFYLFRVKKIKDEQKNVKQIILSHEDIEKEYVVFAQKLKQLTVLFGKRKDKQDALVFFSHIFGDDVIVSGIDYSSADEDVVSFTIKTPNVFVMDRVFQKLASEQVASVYPKIAKSNMNRSDTGNYTLNLAVVLLSKDNQGEEKSDDKAVNQ